MNTSSNAATEYYPVPIDSLMYRDLADCPEDGGDSKSPSATQISEKTHPDSSQEIENMLNLARAEATLETEQRLKKECRAHSELESAKIAQAIEQFRQERQDYFARVESDVVHLALAIAAKILHREAQVDAMLVAGLVRFAIEKLHEGSSVSVRVCPSAIDKWESYLAKTLNNSNVQVIADAHLDSTDCILETDLGSANFSIDAQLKEVERGFFDLLAQRPAIR
jgi:flagellar assembly protein FliH